MSLVEKKLKLFPWTTMFATKANFESGYFAKEGELVSKYLKNGDNVLICGSGNGREARPIVHKANRIVCFDYGLGYLLAGKKLCESQEIKNVHFLLADVLHLPFHSASFDFIFFGTFSSLKENRLMVMNDIYKLLRRDGFVLVCCYLPWAPKAIRYGFPTYKDVIGLEKEVTQYKFNLVEGGQDPEHNRYIFAILSPK